MKFLSLRLAVLWCLLPGSLAHFDWLGYVVMAITLATFALMYRVNKQVSEAAPK
jgi:hypothetical protein